MVWAFVVILGSRAYNEETFPTCSAVARNLPSCCGELLFFHSIYGWFMDERSERLKLFKNGYFNTLICILRISYLCISWGSETAIVILYYFFVINKLLQGACIYRDHSKDSSVTRFQFRYAAITMTLEKSQLAVNPKFCLTLEILC